MEITKEEVKLILNLFEWEDSIHPLQGEYEELFNRLKNEVEE